MGEAFQQYSAYGLQIASALSLPELVAGASERLHRPDVTIELGRLTWAPPPGTYEDGFVCGDEREAYIFVDGVGGFCISEGRSIVVEPDLEVSEGRLRVFLLGGALGLLLHQRGLFVLHASAVLVRGGAVAFLGSSGEGKSTMAGAMHRAGHPILADDIIAIDVHGPFPALMPGFPRIKLWPDAAAQIGYDKAALGEFDPSDERRECRTGTVVAAQPLPIHGLFVLESGRSTALERLSPRDSFQVLLQNSYAAGLLGRSGATPSYFRQSVAVAGAVPTYRLRRRRSLAGLPALAARVTRHVQEEVALQAAALAAGQPAGPAGAPAEVGR